MKLTYIFLLLLLSLNTQLFAQEVKGDSAQLIKQSSKKKNIEQKIVKLPVYGLSFINQGSNTTNLNKINVKDNYKIKVGDKLLAKVYGYDNIELKLEVDRKGAVVLPKYGPLKISNIEFASAKKLIKSALKEIYPNSDSAISFDDVASIEITISGNINRPGTYLIGGFSTLIDALRSAKGFRQNASLRKISLTRNGKSRTIDLYKYLDGSKNFNDLLMKDGDTIKIKTIGKKVSIDGAIRTPSAFELVRGERLHDLVRYAKNLKPTANRSNVVLKRVDKKKGIVVRYIDISKNINLVDGDYIKVNYLVKDEQKYVTIEGEVSNPGNYLYGENLSIATMLKKAEGFKYFADKKNILITRKNIVDGELKTLSFSTDDLKSMLKPFDIITVAKYENYNSIIDTKILGSVRVAGSYRLKKGSSVADLVKIAKGVDTNSNIGASYVVRESLKAKQKATKQKMINRLQEKLSSSIYGAMFDSSDSKEVKIKIINIQNQIAKLQNELKTGLDSSGKISLNLTKTYSSKDESWNFKLENGDILYVPSIEYYIYVEGSVLSPATLVYSKKGRIKDYIGKSGGFAKDYDKESSYILKPNGEARKLDLSARLEPGDTIVVGSKVLTDAN
ncbi:MAG: SLBB domain-containing protein [Sulfurimonas sp.]|nr:SLBB domain-containing protein [Sulfurimonas sp.]